MIQLVLAIACSLAIGAIFKHAAELGMERMYLLTTNYLVACGAGLTLTAAESRLAVQAALASPDFLLISVFAGVILIGGFFLFALATERAGMSLTIAVMRVGVAIPFVGSWLLWGETPSLAHWGGLALVGIALVLITRPSERPGRHQPKARILSTMGLLVLVFLTGGIGDLTFKAFDVWHGGIVPSHVFIGLAFGVSFLLGVSVSVRQRAGWPTPRTLGWGAILGLVNYGSILFILGAVAQMPAAVVFPTHAMSVVVGGALLGILIWRERLSRVNMAGIALAAVAVTLLNA